MFVLSSEDNGRTAPQLPSGHTLFQFRRNHKFLFALVVLDAKQVRFATHLAVFYIGLPAADGLIHRRLVGFAASGALESGFHLAILGCFHRLFTLRSPVFHAILVKLWVSLCTQEYL